MEDAKAFKELANSVGLTAQIEEPHTNRSGLSSKFYHLHLRGISPHFIPIDIYLNDD
jgi:hypothetical protein